jgi:hypothetical protein
VVDATYGGKQVHVGEDGTVFVSPPEKNARAAEQGRRSSQVTEASEALRERSVRLSGASGARGRGELGPVACELDIPWSQAAAIRSTPSRTSNPAS